MTSFNTLVANLFTYNNENKLITTALILKVFKSCALFTLYNVQNNANFFILFFMIYAISSLFTYSIQLLIDQNTFKSKLPYGRIIMCGCINILLNYFLLYGLVLSGPIRSIFICEMNDTIIIAILTTINNIHQQSPSKIRGTALYLVSVLLLLFFDHDDTHINYDGHSNNVYHKILNLSDHKKGVCYLLLSLLIRLVHEKLMRNLSIQMGGGGMKMTRLVSYICQSFLCLTFYAFQRMLQASSDNKAATDLFVNPLAATTTWYFTTSWIFQIIFVALTIYVANFYLDIVCSNKLDKYAYARLATLTSYLAAYLIYCYKRSFTSPELPNLADHFNLASTPLYYPNLNNSSTVPGREGNYFTLLNTNPHLLSMGAYVGLILLVLAVINLTSNAQKSCKGHFVGYSTFSGLPLYVYSAGQFSTISHSFKSIIVNFVAQISKDQGSKPIFYFLLANLAFMLVEIVYGAWTNSLGLISDGFHMFFDCSALIMGLFASLMSAWKPNKTYTYGYGRAEILSGFLNGLFLLLVSVNVFTAAVDRLFEPPTIESEQLLLVSFIGLLINLIGIYAFHFSGGNPMSSTQGTSQQHIHHKEPDSHSHHHHPHDHHHHHHTSDEHCLIDQDRNDPIKSTTIATSPNGYPVFVVRDHTDQSSMSVGKANESGVILPPFSPKKHVTFQVTGHENMSRKDSNHDAHTHQHDHHHHGCHSHNHGNMNMRGIFLHVLADALGSVGVIISSFLVERYGWYRADPICSLFASVLIFCSVLPLLKESFLILALRTPDELIPSLVELAEEFTRLPYVKSCGRGHIWKLSSNNYVSTYRILIDVNAPPLYESNIQNQIVNKLRSRLKRELGEGIDCFTTVQTDRDTFFHHLSGVSGSPPQTMIRKLQDLYPTNTEHLVAVYDGQIDKNIMRSPPLSSKKLSLPFNRSNPTMSRGFQQTADPNSGSIIMLPEMANVSLLNDQNQFSKHL